MQKNATVVNVDEDLHEDEVRIFWLLRAILPKFEICEQIFKFANKVELLEEVSVSHEPWRIECGHWEASWSTHWDESNEHKKVGTHDYDLWTLSPV